MDWVFINTILLVIAIGLLVHVIRTAATAYDILFYGGLSNDEIIDILKTDKKDLQRKLSILKIEISDQVLKDQKKQKERNDEKNKT